MVGGNDLWPRETNIIAGGWLLGRPRCVFYMYAPPGVSLTSSLASLVDAVQSPHVLLNWCYCCILISGVHYCDSGGPSTAICGTACPRQAYIPFACPPGPRIDSFKDPTIRLWAANFLSLARSLCVFFLFALSSFFLLSSPPSITAAVP